MDINQLISIIKNKLSEKIKIENINIEDKSFLHKKHFSNDKSKFHIKLVVNSNYLRKKNKIDSTKEIYKVLDEELKNYIHSIQILIN